MWTRFFDMHSGGYAKTPYEKIYLELPRDEAIAFFRLRFQQDPFNVACDCCGENFSVHEPDETLEECTGFERNCDYRNGKYVEEQAPSQMKIRKSCNTKESDPWGLYIPLKEFRKHKDILIMSKRAIAKWKKDIAK